MYQLADYQWMLQDAVRTEAYVRAIQGAVRPGDTVVEIGTGVGYFAVIACRAGASRVWAIEPNPAVRLGPELARANGCDDRVEFIKDVSTRVAVGPADVLVSDLRGVLPLLAEHVPSIVDARRRLLRPGGVQIPARDRIQLALVRADEAPATPAADPHGVALGPLERALTHQWTARSIGAGELMSAPRPWATIDYRTVETPDLDGTVELTASAAGAVGGIGAWFDTELHGGRGFSTAPGEPATVYRHGFFPLPDPLRLGQGDTVRISLRAKLVGSEYVWRWAGLVLDGPARGNEFSRSTFHALPLDPKWLRRRADRFIPRLGREGEAHAWILARMRGGAALGDIAREAATAFPDVFPDFAVALRAVADLSERYGE